MPTNKKAVTVYLDKRLYRLVTRAAKADGRSVTNFVENVLCRRHIEDAKRQSPAGGKA